MIIEISFGLVGGINFGMEKSFGILKDLMVKYPHAVWNKIVKKDKVKYIVEID